MKKIITSFFILFAGTIFSQVDSVVMTNGLKATIKVVNMDENSVSYTFPGDGSGTIYKIKKSEIKTLYLNTVLGDNNPTQVIIGSKKEEPKGGSYPKLDKYCENFVGFNMGQVLYTTFSFHYQRLFSDGLFGVKLYGGHNISPKAIPVTIKASDNSIVYNPSANYMSEYRKNTFGVEFNLFPFYQRKISYYIGPSFQYGTFDASYLVTSTVYPAFPLQPYAVTETKTISCSNYSFIISNGVLFRLSEHFFMDCSVGIGIQRLNFDTFGQLVATRGSLQIAMGYSF